MTDNTDVTAATPAAGETMPAAHSPAPETYYEPAEQTPEHHEEQFQDEPAEEPADLGEILDEARPKKLSGAQRAKQQRERLQNENNELRQRLSEFERYISERDSERDAQRDAQRDAELERRKRDEAHLSRLNEAKGVISDWDQVLSKMKGATIRDDLADEITRSDKSPLLTYHLAKNPNKLDELNSMSQRDMVREIARLESTLRMPEGKRQTSAPPPPSRLSGGAAPSPDPRTGPHDMNEYAAWRKRDQEQRRGR